MTYYIIIPAYNEEQYITQTLNSIVQQTHLPKKIIVVNDSSTDKTAELVSSFCDSYPFIQLVTKVSKNKHLPGSKVIEAFKEGLKYITDDFDFIVKLDADLILPNNYFQKIAEAFHSNSKLGMAGGFAYIKNDEKWILENLTDKDHIRGAFKSYRNECFKQIGGLKSAMGWDTIDELLCRYYGWEIQTFEDLKVKHLKPTGANYDKTARYKQGQAFYQMGYGFILTCIASIKLALRKKKPLLTLDYIVGFTKAKKEQKPILVTPQQARFIQKYRWQKIRQKIWK